MLFRSGAVAEAEEAEIVVVRRAFCAHEHGATAGGFLHHREAENVDVELCAPSRVDHIEHGVVESTNPRHGGKATCSQRSPVAARFSTTSASTIR